MLRTLKKFGLPVEDLLTVFQAYIRPITEYCAPVWHSSLTSADSNQIESIQKRALRIILGREYQTYENALITTKLITLSERRVQLCVKFAKSLEKNFPQWLPPKQSELRALRFSDQYRPVKCRTERYRKSALPFLVRLLNQK